MWMWSELNEEKLLKFVTHTLTLLHTAVDSTPFNCALGSATLTAHVSALA